MLQKQIMSIVLRVNKSMRILPRRNLAAHELVFPFEVLTSLLCRSVRVMLMVEVVVRLYNPPPFASARRIATRRR